LFTSAGGWLFSHAPDGQWDPSRVGLASRGSIAAFKRFRKLSEAGSGILRRSMDCITATNASRRDAARFLIGTSDGLRMARSAGIPLAVSAIPPFADGSTTRAFTTVHGLFIAKHGTNKAIAHDLFADYLTHSHVMSALSNGAVSPIALLTDAVQDPWSFAVLVLVGGGCDTPGGLGVRDLGVK
jgi:maltose-binding protein MalE